MAALLTLSVVFLAGGPKVQPLRICADPNNLPFSNREEQGFENALARLLAKDLHRELEYTWWPQRRGFVRNTLAAGRCDVIMGVPAHFEQALTTHPYYTSTYVFVSQQRRHLAVESFDDPRLSALRIGVQMVGDDFANTPPAHALSARGLVGNVVGYSVLGDYSRPDPPARIVDAVVDGDVDLAVVWGPLAGFFARRASVALEVHPVSESPSLTPPAIPFTFAISMGVRRADRDLKQQLDRFIDRRQLDIDAILSSFGVPRAREKEAS